MLTELITRNAMIAFERFQKQEKDACRAFERKHLIRQMANYMSIASGREVTVDAVRAALYDYFPADGSPPTRDWRADYLEAFCVVVGVPASRLTHGDYDGEGRVDEEGYARFYSTIVGKQLDPKQVRRINRNLRREMEVPGLFDLVAEIAEAMLQATSQAEASQSAYEAIRRSRIWNRKSADSKDVSEA